MSVNSLMLLWEDLNTNHSLKYLLTNRLNQDCLENFFSIMRSRGGHRDNPNTVEFRAAYRSVCIDSLFVKSQNTNCIEDVDSFLLKLGNVPSGSKQSTPVLVSDQTTVSPPLSHDLAGVSNMPPNMTPQEGNIIVYLAGYIGKKAISKFKCSDCVSIWRKPDAASSSTLYAFIDNKQYSDLTVGGLFYPSSVLVKFVTCLESVFREQVPIAIHGSKLGVNFMSKVQSSASAPRVTCSNDACLPSHSYMVQLYFIVRVHHYLREQNRQMQQPHAKRNRKTLKLMHL